MSTKPAPLGPDPHDLTFSAEQLHQLPIVEQVRILPARRAAGLPDPDQPSRKPPVRVSKVVQLDQPHYNTRVAAMLIGSTYEAMKKWRQRGIGPKYIQVKKGGAVSYPLSSLLHYVATHTVHPSREQAA